MNDDACRDAHGWAARPWYDALEAFLTEHRLCRPGLDAPHLTDTVVALSCACSTRIVGGLPRRPSAGH